MKYLQVMVKLTNKIRECNHTISQFPLLAIGKSSGAQKMGGGGTQAELGSTNSCSNYEDEPKWKCIFQEQR